jgi:hypothetical protein
MVDIYLYLYICTYISLHAEALVISHTWPALTGPMTSSNQHQSKYILEIVLVNGRVFGGVGAPLLAPLSTARAAAAVQSFGFGSAWGL